VGCTVSHHLLGVLPVSAQPPPPPLHTSQLQAPLKGFLNDVSLGHLQHKRLLRRLANNCHTMSIRLAGRILGIVRCSFSPHLPTSATPQKIVHLRVPPIFLLLLPHISPFQACTIFSEFRLDLPYDDSEVRLRVTYVT
jgi:hypothetical protein